MGGTKPKIHRIRFCDQRLNEKYLSLNLSPDATQRIPSSDKNGRLYKKAPYAVTHSISNLTHKWICYEDVVIQWQNMNFIDNDHKLAEAMFDHVHRNGYFDPEGTPLVSLRELKEVFSLKRSKNVLLYFLASYCFSQKRGFWYVPNINRKVLDPISFENLFKGYFYYAYPIKHKEGFAISMYEGILREKK